MVCANVYVYNMYEIKTQNTLLAWVRNKIY